MQYHPDEPRAQARERVFGRMRTSDGDGRHSMLAVLLAVSIFVGTGAFGFWQATSPNRVQDQFELGVAQLTDIDNYLAAELPDLRATATASNETAFDLPGYPLPISVTRSELLETEDADLREIVLERSAAVVYVSGMKAFDHTGRQDLGFLTSEWWMSRVVSLLSGNMHERAELIAVLAFLTAAVATTLIFARRSAGDGLRSVGFAVLAGAVPGVVFMAAGAYWFGRAGGSDPFVRSIAAILEAFFVVPRRDYLIVTTVGAFFAVVGYLLPLIDRIVSSGNVDGDTTVGAGYEIREYPAGDFDAVAEEAPEVAVSERGSPGSPG